VTSPAGDPEAVPGLEERLRRLDEIVSALEADDVELQRALELFEEGIAHVRQAEEILARAELRVEELLNTDDGSVRTRPLDPGDG
jgi:exodeoxyribonuclease VII small subunit